MMMRTIDCCYRSKLTLNIELNHVPA